jgi:hypothetical protein
VSFDECRSFVLCHLQDNLIAARFANRRIHSGCGALCCLVAPGSRTTSDLSPLTEGKRKTRCGSRAGDFAVAHKTTPASTTMW